MAAALFFLWPFTATIILVSADEYAYTKIVGTSLDPGITGGVSFYRINATHVRVTANVTGITQNPNTPHGMHIHEYGDLSMWNGTSVGSHYVGDGSSSHGCPETNGTTRHEGDLGNWIVSGGVINQQKDVDLIALSGLYSVIGRALVLHETTDDCANILSSGGRIAFGVIGISNPANNGNINNTAAYETNGTQIAYCRLASTQGNTVAGELWLTSIGSAGTLISGYVSGLSNNSEHGIHIHTYGDMSSVDGSAAGAHYNPNAAPHALPHTQPRHVGDLGNLIVYDSNGNAWYNETMEIVFLDPPQSVVGRAVIVHANVDDGCTPNTGNAGARWGQCVIGLGNTATWYPPTVPVSVPPQTGSMCSPPTIPLLPVTSDATILSVLLAPPVTLFNTFLMNAFGSRVLLR
jgi:Cu-Zn family superoxide dismutase